MKKLDLNWSIYTILKEYPEAIEIIKELGFGEISRSGMINTVGKIMTLPKGAVLRGIDLDIIKRTFIDKGYEIIE